MRVLSPLCCFGQHLGPLQYLHLSLIFLELTFPKPTITVNIADNVTLSVPKPTQRNLRWRHNGQVVPQWSNLRQITISNVTQDDEGIYECYLFKRRSLGGHAIMRLIVRGTYYHGAINWDQFITPWYYTR